MDRHVVRRLLKQRSIPDAQRHSLDLHINVSSMLDSLFMSRIRAFADIRRRPQGLGSGGSGVAESFGGNETADLLMNLKNGSIQQREKYKTIRHRFTSFFPSL